jgi:hypothetical protein
MPREHMTTAKVIELVCHALTRGNTTEASAIAKEQYPFVRSEKAARRYTEYQMTSVFLRDGFTDRYSGERLVFPGTLRLLSLVLPEEFPAHPNWKMSASHLVYWQLFPTIDHVVPVTRGGKDDVSNWVTTSMLRNSAKAHWTFEELGWSLHPPGSAEAWDGLTRWFVEYTETRPELCQSPYVRRWRRAAITVLDESPP